MTGAKSNQLLQDAADTSLNYEPENIKNEELGYDPYSNISLGEGRSFWHKLFGPLTTKTQRSAVISLFTSALGVAVFSYPKTFSQYGYILGTIGILYSAFCTTVSYAIIAELCGMYPNHTLYSELVQHYLGRFWSRYTSWILIIYFFGCLIGFTIVVTTFFQEIFGLRIANYLELDYDQSFKKQLGLLISIVLAIAYFLGSVLRRAGVIRYLGFLVVFMIFYLICVTIYQTKGYMEEVKPRYEAFGSGKIFECALHFGVFLFAFDSVQGFHQVYTAMAMPTVRRIKKVGLKVSLVLLVPFYIFTIFAYLSLGHTMQDKSFDIFPSKRPLSTDPDDVYMTILKCVMMVSLLASYIVNSIPLKLQMMDHFKLKETDFNHVMLAAIISVGTGFLSFIYPEITNWMSLLGALGANSLAVLLPSLCFYRAVSGKKEYEFTLKMVVVWAGVTTFMSMLCILATCSDMAGYHPDW